MTEAERVLLAAAARAVLSGDRGELVDQLDRPYAGAAVAARACPGTAAACAVPERRTASTIATPDLMLANGTGGFADGGREYVIVLEGEQETPLPWVNVHRQSRRSAPSCPTSGAAYTWAENSRENRLTPFANDPVTRPDRRGHLPARRGDRRRLVLHAGAAAAHRRRGRFVIRHAAGVSRVRPRVARHRPRAGGVRGRATIRSSSRCSRSPTAADRPRRLSVFAYDEWRLGPPRAGEHLHVVTECDDGRSAPCSPAIRTTRSSPHRVAFATRASRSHSATGDRLEFLGGTDRLRRRRRRCAGASLSGEFGAGLDPCAALQVRIDLEPGETRQSASCWARAATASMPATWLRPPPERGARRCGARAQSSGAWDATLGAIRCATPGRLLRPAHEPLAAVPGAELPAVGAHRLLPAGRRLRLPRPAAGRDGAARSSRPDLAARAPPARRRAPVRAKATCSTGGTSPPDAGPAPAAPTTCCGCRTRSPTTSSRPATRRVLDASRAVPRGAGARARRDGGVRPAGVVANERRALRALHARDRAAA